MPDEELIEQLVGAARELAAESPSGEVDGEDVAKRIDADPEDPGAKMYHAFKVAERRGRLACRGWRGGMGLPRMIRTE
jgi:hypothetical protein